VSSPGSARGRVVSDERDQSRRLKVVNLNRNAAVAVVVSSWPRRRPVTTAVTVSLATRPTCMTTHPAKLNHTSRLLYVNRHHCQLDSTISYYVTVSTMRFFDSVQPFRRAAITPALCRGYTHRFLRPRCCLTPPSLPRLKNFVRGNRTRRLTCPIFSSEKLKQHLG